MVEDARKVRRALELLDMELLDMELLDKANTRRKASLERVRTGGPDGEYQAYRGIVRVPGPLFFLRMQPLSRQPALVPAATPRQSVAGRAKLGRNKRDH
jgi:hypothetical protein